MGVSFHRGILTEAGSSWGKNVIIHFSKYMRCDYL
jgi:hypothetical protein